MAMQDICVRALSKFRRRTRRNLARSHVGRAGTLAADADRGHEASCSRRRSFANLVGDFYGVLARAIGPDGEIAFVHGEWYSNAQHVAMLEYNASAISSLATDGTSVIGGGEDAFVQLSSGAVDWTRPIQGDGHRLPQLSLARDRLIPMFVGRG